MTAMTLSIVLLWAAVIALALLVWALSRQVGVLFERVSPMGALVTDSGPAVGSLSPRFDLRTLAGAPLPIGGEQARPTLVFFLSPTCPVCKKLLPALAALVADEARAVQVVLASDGAPDEHRRFIASQRLDALPYVLSQELGMSYRVSKLPYAVVLDRSGRVAAKGLVNSREQLDSLCNALDMGVASIQQYLGTATATA